MTGRLDQLTFDEALDVIAQVAYPLGLVKRAEGEGLPGVSELWGQIPEAARNVLVPALAGGGLGAASALWQQPGRRKPLQRALTGAGLGALLGTGMQLARGAQPGIGDPTNRMAEVDALAAAEKAKQQQLQQQVNQAEAGAGSGIVTGQHAIVQPGNTTVLPTSRAMQHGNERLQVGVGNALGFHPGESVRPAGFLQDLTVGPNGLDPADANPVAAGAAGGVAGTLPWWATKNQATRALLQGKVKDAPVEFDSRQLEALRGTQQRLLELGRGEGQSLAAIRAHGTNAPQMPRTWGLERILRGPGGMDHPPSLAPPPDIPASPSMTGDLLARRGPLNIGMPEPAAAPPSQPIPTAPRVSGQVVRDGVRGIQSVLPTRSRWSRLAGGAGSSALSYLLSRLLLNQFEGPATHAP
jgi:hypothetical protein